MEIFVYQYAYLHSLFCETDRKEYTKHIIKMQQCQQYLDLGHHDKTNTSYIQSFSGFLAYTQHSRRSTKQIHKNNLF